MSLVDVPLYQNLFNKIQDYFMKDNKPRKIYIYGGTNHESYQRYNAIIEKLEKMQKDKQNFINIFKYKQWRVQNQHIIESLFNNKDSSFAIETFRKLISTQNIYEKMLGIMRKNPMKSQSSLIEMENIQQNLQQIFRKIKVYQSLLLLICQYPTQYNNEKINNIFNTEVFFKIQKKQLQNICCFRTTFKLIEGFLKQFSKIKYYKQRQFQSIVTQRIIDPIQSLIGSYKQIQFCLPSIKDYNTEALQKCIDKKFGQIGYQEMKKIKDIASEQTKIVKNIKKIKEKIEDIIIFTNYPFQTIKPQINLNKTTQEIIKQIQTLQQIVKYYHQFINKIIFSLQETSEKIQRQDLNTKEVLYKKKNKWKNVFQNAKNILQKMIKNGNSITTNQKNPKITPASQNYNNKQEQTKLIKEIKLLQWKNHQKQQQLFQTNKTKVQLSKELQDIKFGIKQITKELNIEFQPYFSEEQIIRISFEAISKNIKKLMQNKQSIDRSNQKNADLQKKNFQLKKSNNKLDLKLIEANGRIKQLESNSARVHKENHKYYEQNMELQQQNKNLKILCDQISSKYKKIQEKEQLPFKEQKKQIQMDQVVKLNLQFEQQFYKQSEEQIINAFTENQKQLNGQLGQKIEHYMKKLTRIQQTMRSCQIMIRSKKDRSKQLLQELNQTKRQNQIIQFNQQQENIKIRDLHFQLTQKDKQINQLKRQISLQKKQIRNLNYDLEIETQTVKNLNLQVERFELQFQMMEGGQKLSDNEQLNKQMQEKIKQLKQQLEKCNRKIKQNQQDIIKLKKKLQLVESQRKNTIDQLEKQKKITHQLTIKISSQSIRSKIQQNSYIINKLSYQNQIQFKKHKQSLKQLYLSRYIPQNKQQATSFCLAYIDRLFQNELLQDLIHYKYRILCHLQKITTKKVLKTKLIYKMDPVNSANFHKYIDGAKNLLTVVKTIKGMYLVGFYLGIYQQQQMMAQPGLLISLNNNESYTLKDPVNSKKFRGMVYDPYYIIYGNAQMRIRVADHTFFSNFGINNSYYNNRQKKLIDFVGEDNHDIDIVSYEVYQVQFEEDQEERRWEE